MHAHRVDVFNRADDDAIVRLVADNFHFIFFPAQNAFLDQNFVRRRSINAALDDLDIFGLIIGNTAACAAHGERGANDRRQTNVIHNLERLRECLDLVRTGRIETDLGHGIAEEFAIFRLVDGFRRRANHLDVVFFQRAHFLERERAIQCGLATHGGQ